MRYVCKIKDHNFLAVRPAFPTLPTPHLVFKFYLRTMAIAVASPIPADQLGLLEPLVAAVRFVIQNRGGCTRFFIKKSWVELYALQWQLRCSYSMITVSEDASISLEMECC